MLPSYIINTSRERKYYEKCINLLNKNNNSTSQIYNENNKCIYEYDKKNIYLIHNSKKIKINL
jgi:hypothetical protein